jgi:hypothetical protein
MKIDLRRARGFFVVAISGAIVGTSVLVHKNAQVPGDEKTAAVDPNSRQ